MRKPIYFHRKPVTDRHTYIYMYVAVPGRNRTLFRCVFHSHCCVRSAIAQNFVKGGAHTRCVNVASIDEFTQRV